MGDRDRNDAFSVADAVAKYSLRLVVAMACTIVAGIASFAVLKDWAASVFARNPVEFAVWSIMAAVLGAGIASFFTSFLLGADARKRAADFGDLPRFSALERDCMQLLCEMEDGAAHRVEERETRRGYAAERLAEDGYLDLCGYGSGWADYRLSRDARRVLSARAREWGRAKRGAGIPDGSIFAPENDLPPAGSDFDLDAAVARLMRIG